jgi:hypothetical protein
MGPFVSVDVLGLDNSFPRPGWVVIDAAREAGFSGELELDTTPPVQVFLDRGRIYLAERTTDPPLGARLVDAGALDAGQLDHGTIRIGEVDHLGRLFERSPSVDRQVVMVMLELMTEECTAWVAAQAVRGVRVAPYQHHPSGVHRWERDRARPVDLLPGMPLPAPDPAHAPAAVPPPALSPFDDLDGDVRIVWDEPAFGDVTPPPARSAAGPDLELSAAGSEAVLTVDEQVDVSAHDRPDDATTAGAPEPDPMRYDVLVASDALEGFEVIWPSGEIDEGFPLGAPPARPLLDDEHDAGAHGVDAADPTPVAPGRPAPFVGTVELPLQFVLPDREVEVSEPVVPIPEVSDDVVMAVRRAIAAIETGFGEEWLPAAASPAPGTGSPSPSAGSTGGSSFGRTAPSPVHAVGTARIVPAADQPGETMVEQAPAPTEPTASPTIVATAQAGHRTAEQQPVEAQPGPSAAAEPAGDQRRSALRRLIDGLRRR